VLTQIFPASIQLLLKKNLSGVGALVHPKVGGSPSLAARREQNAGSGLNTGSLSLPKTGIGEMNDIGKGAAEIRKHRQVNQYGKEANSGNERRSDGHQKKKISQRLEGKAGALKKWESFKMRAMTVEKQKNGRKMEQRSRVPEE